MTISIPSDIVSLDPHGSNDDPSEQIRDTIYEPLVTHDEDLNIVPALAEEYEQVDETTWSFKLREGVTFHDGSEFNADVIKANIERTQDPARTSARASLLDMVSEVNIIDDYNLELVTEYPYAPLLNNLSHGAGKMISKDLIDADYENALEQAEMNMMLLSKTSVSLSVKWLKRDLSGPNTSSLNREVRVKKLLFHAMKNTGMYRHCFRI